jgi:hypothetical protein
MPPHTRSQRRRQNARQQPRPSASVETTRREPSTGTTVNLEAPVEAPAMSAPAAPSRATRAATPRRRVISRPAPEPIDYTKDYAAARIDLRRIALWAVLLFVAMVALYFSGIV